MRTLPLALGSVLLLTALVPLPGHAASGDAFAAVVQPGDPDVRLNLQTALVTVGFVDANGNGVPDAAQPDETIYLHVSGSYLVGYGDLRLTPFWDYPAGTAVDFTNRDFGRQLTPLQGWFASSPSGTWYLDVANARAVAAGDVRVTGALGGTKVLPGDPDVGASLTPAQDTVTPALRVGWHDAQGDGKHTLDEPYYLDVNLDRQVGPGDLRFLPTGLGVDDLVTQAQLQAAVQAQQQRDAQLQAGQASLAGQLAALAANVGDQGQWLLVLGWVDLVGVAAVAWYARHLHRQAGRPAHDGAPALEQGFR